MKLTRQRYQQGSLEIQFLTVNGRAELVVQDAASYQSLLDRLEELEVAAAIRVGLEEAKAGKGQPAIKALEDLGKKLGLRRRNHARGTATVEPAAR